MSPRCILKRTNTSALVKYNWGRGAQLSEAFKGIAAAVRGILDE
jgi:hypothetical protein